MIGRGIPWILPVVATLVFAPAAFGGTARAAPADLVVVVSIDGLRWDAPERAGASALARMKKEGASCRALLPPFPSLTFPSHASLATGVFPDRHGIMGNEFDDRTLGRFHRDDDPSWLLAEPVWVTAEKQGVRTAVFHWPFSNGAWHGVAAGLSLPFSDVPDATTIATILEWLTLEKTDRPRLVLSYLHGPDGAGHRNGPDSPEVLEHVRESDRLVGRLMRALESVPRSALVVVSDHGMAAVDRVLRTEGVPAAGGGRRARFVSSGAVCNVYCPDGESCSAAEKGLRRFPGIVVLRRADLPASLRYSRPDRTGDLVAIAPRGAYFEDGPPGGRPPARGMHGYPPDWRDMQGVFFAGGAGVKRGGRENALRAVDVAPFVCRLLGITPPDGIDGRAPEDLLSAQAGPPQARSRMAPPGGAPP